MNGPDDTPTVANGGVPNFRLVPPEAVSIMPPEAARSAVPLKPETARAVDDQLTRYLDALVTAGLDSPKFASALASAAALGHDEIGHAAGLMQHRVLQAELTCAAQAIACKALDDINARLTALVPADDAVLLAPRKLLGLVTMGSGLSAYVQRLESSAGPMQASLSELQAGREAVQKALAAIEAVRIKLWDAMQQLAAAVRFADALDRRLGERLDDLTAREPERARALAQVPAQARRALAELLDQQAVCVTGYLALDRLKKAGRETINGCLRVASTVGAFVAEAGGVGEDDASRASRLRALHGQSRQAVAALQALHVAAQAVLDGNRALVAAQVQRRQAATEALGPRPAREPGRVRVHGPVSL